MTIQMQELNWDHAIDVPLELLADEDEGDVEVLTRKHRNRLMTSLLTAKPNAYLSSGQ